MNARYARVSPISPLISDIRYEKPPSDTISISDIENLAPSDLAGSILVEILHSVKGGDVEQGVRTSKQFSRVCDCSLSLVFIYLACLYCLSPYMFDISCA